MNHKGMQFVHDNRSLVEKWANDPTENETVRRKAMVALEEYKKENGGDYHGY
jgi:hypothetical protein